MIPVSTYTINPFSQATGVDLSQYTTVASSYYNPPILDKFVCPSFDSSTLTKEQKIDAIDKYIANVNRFFGQLRHNLKAAKKEGLVDLENAYRNHYNYHIAQRSLAQKCKSIVKYGGDSTTVGTFSFPPPPPPVDETPTNPINQPTQVGNAEPNPSPVSQLSTNEVKKKIIEIIIKEGGAAGIDSIYDELNTDRTKQNVVDIIDSMESVTQLSHGDYIIREEDLKTKKEKEEEKKETNKVTYLLLGVGAAILIMNFIK